MFDFLVQYCLALAKHLNNFGAALLLQLQSAFLSYDNKHKLCKLKTILKLYIYEKVIKKIKINIKTYVSTKTFFWMFILGAQYKLLTTKTD